MATTTLTVLVAVSEVESNTVRHAQSMLPRLVIWYRECARLRPWVHLDLRIDQAKLARISGDLPEAIRLLEDGLKGAVDRRAVEAYVAAVGERDGAQAARIARQRLEPRLVKRPTL